MVAKSGPILPKLVVAGPNLATKIGPGDHFWQPKVVPPDQFGLLRMVLLPYSDTGPLLVAKSGPILPKLVVAGPNLATKIGPGDHFWQPKVVPPDQFGLLRMVLLPYSDC